MCRFSVVPFCIVTFLNLPGVCLAQLNSGSALSPGDAAALVSAHELSIPSKARKAFIKGSRRLSEKDSAGSIPEFQQAIKEFPAYYEAYDRIGAAELDLHRWVDAEGAFRKSIELSDGRCAPAHYGLGLVLCNDEKRLAEAEGVVRAGLDLNPADVDGNFTLAWVLYKRRRLPDAETSVRQAIRYRPKFPEAYLLLGQIHLRQSNRSALVEHLDAYLKLAPDGPQSAKVRAVREETERALAREKTGAVVAKADP